MPLGTVFGTGMLHAFGTLEVISLAPTNSTRLEMMPLIGTPPTCTRCPQFPLTTALVLDRSGSGVPVASMVASRDGRAEHRDFLSAFKQRVRCHCEGWTPSCFIIDDSAALIGAIRCAWGVRSVSGNGTPDQIPAGASVPARTPYRVAKRYLVTSITLRVL